MGFDASVYCYRRQLAVVTSWLTASVGYEAVDAPVRDVPLGSTDLHLGGAVRAALEDTRSDLPEERAAKHPRQSPVLRHFGLTSWSKLAAEGLLVEVSTHADALDAATEVRVIPSKRVGSSDLQLLGAEAAVVTAQPEPLGAAIWEAFARCQPPLVRDEEVAQAPAPDEVPAERQPVGFGPKTVWVAVRDRSLDEVASALRLADAERVEWDPGVAVAVEDDVRVFVTPPVDGWTLAVGAALDWSPGEVAEWLATLSRALGEVQFFGTHRVGDYAAWARAVDGEVRRVFVFTGDVVEEGTADDAERSLGIDLEERFPGEDDVLAMAGAWSLDPTTLETRESAPGGGLLGRLPATHG